MNDPGWQDFLLPALLGLGGRVLFIAQSAREKLSLSLVWELPIALVMGVVGKGIADWMNLDGFPEYAMTISVAYVGPDLFDVCFQHFVRPYIVSIVEKLTRK